LSYFYKNAFAMVFPTLIGPDNLPPLEAFYYGCPVIASAVDGADEQLGNNALLFNPFKVDELVEKIILLKENNKIREMLIKKGLDRSKKWTSDDYGNALILLVEKFTPYLECCDFKNYKYKFS